MDGGGEPGEALREALDIPGGDSPCPAGEGFPEESRGRVGVNRGGVKGGHGVGAAWAAPAEDLAGESAGVDGPSGPGFAA